MQRDLLTLRQLQVLIRQGINNALPLSYWISAEISEIKVNYSGHCYLELVEKESGKQTPSAKISAVIWRNKFGIINSYFNAGAGCELSEGLKILFRCTVNYHELYGISLEILDVDPLYTLGDMQMQRQQNIQRLRDEGVFDMNRSLDMPIVLQKIAVISSRKAAGYQDFMNELNSSPYHFDVSLFDSFMQGDATEDGVISALETISGRLDSFDAVVVIRGGGSQSDLAVFDSYRLCCHLAQFPLPVITGIGHDKDESIADMVAAVPLKTPTAVAGYLIDSLAGFDGWLQQIANEIYEYSVSFISDEYRDLQMLGYNLSRSVNAMSRRHLINISRLENDLEGKVKAYVVSEQQMLRNSWAAVEGRVKLIFGEGRRKLEGLEKLIEAKDPRRILALGFSMVRVNGKTISDSSQLSDGQHIDLIFSQGSATAEVINTKDGKSKNYI